MKQDLVKLHHMRSQKDFPELKLEENEYVELAITRSRIGLLGIWGGTAATLVLMLVIAVGISAGGLMTNLDSMAIAYTYLIILIASGAVIIAALVSSKVYKENRLYVTNKRLIHHQATSLFSKSVNIIELVAIEDVSFKQINIVEYIFKLGTIRMSTVGDETTYTFKYVNTPHDELDLITHLVHVEKEKTKRHKRPVTEEDEDESQESESDE